MEEIVRLTVCGSDPSVRHMAEVDQRDAVRTMADLEGVDEQLLIKKMGLYLARQDGSEAENAYREACLLFLEMKFKEAAAQTLTVTRLDKDVLHDKAMILRAVALRQAGDHFGAIAACEEAARSLPRENLPITWAILQHLNGTLLLEMARFNEAQWYLQMALKNYEQAELGDIYWCALILLQLASLPVGNETAAEAADKITKATAIIRDLRGAEHPEMARCLRELARHQVLAGQPEKALTTFTGSLAIDNKTLGKDHYRTLLDMRGLHKLLSRSKDKAGALSSIKSLIRSSSEVVTDEVSLEDAMELIELLKMNGQNEEAEEAFHRLEAWSDGLGELHPANAFYYICMGELAAETMPKEGLERMELGLQCDAGNGSRDLFRTAFCLERVADQCMEQNKPQEAVRYMERALIVLKLCYGEFSDHERVVKAYDKMQKLYQAAGASLMAAINSMHHLTILGKYLGELNATMAEDYTLLGNKALEAGLQYEAEQCLRRAYVIQRVLSGKSSRSGSGTGAGAGAVKKARDAYEKLLRETFRFSDERIAARMVAVEQDRRLLDLFPPTPDLLPPTESKRGANE